MTRILITGSDGFTAHHLIELLSNEKKTSLFTCDLRHRPQKNNHFVCDLSDPLKTYNLLKETKPDQIYNLAGTFSNNYETDYKTNVITTKNLLDSILILRKKCRVLLIGSSAEYGWVTKLQPAINEDEHLNPVSIYGLTKVFQTYLMKYYATVHKLNVLMARPFNLMGNRMSDNLFLGKLEKQIAEYKKGNINNIFLGNLQNKRDYLEVTKAVRLYKLIMDSGIRGEVYNVGSGKSIKIYGLMKLILEKNGLSTKIVKHKKQVSPLKHDVAELRADMSKTLKLYKRK